MNKKLYITLCIIFLIIFTISYTVQGITIDEVFDEKKNEIQTKIDETNTQIEQVQGQISEVSEELKEINEKIANYQQEINQINTQMLQLEVDIKNTEQQLQQAEENYAKQKKLFEERIVAMYKAGETLYLEVLLNSKSIEEFISKFFYLNEIIELDRQLIQNVQNEKVRIETKNTQLLAQQEQLKKLKDNKARTSITLQNTKVVRNSYLSQLNEEEQQKQNDLAQYEKDMEDLEQDILSITLSSMNQDYAGGSLIWPAPGYRTITSPYGMRIHPVFHVLRLHTGVDIGAPLGADIVAANSGVVTLATYTASYGNYIMIDHGGGVVTLYAHGQDGTMQVSVGDIVKAGDVLMKAGSTGWSTGPHLHFEIRINGNTIDPLPYLLNTASSNLNSLNTDTNNEISNTVNNSTIINNQINTN